MSAYVPGSKTVDKNAAEVMDFNLSLRPDGEWASTLVAPPTDEITRLREANKALERVCEAATDLSTALYELRPSDRAWPTPEVMKPIWEARSRVEEAVGLYTLVRYRHDLAAVNPKVNAK